MSSAVTDKSKWDVLQAKLHEARVQRAFSVFRDAGIEPILIKGWAAARNYPQEQIRHFGDVDLAVAPEDFNRALRLVRSTKNAWLFIDLHESLRDLDSVDWSNLFENSRLADLNSISVRILRPEDHLRVLCAHWLIDGGRSRDKLWDIYHAVAHRPPDFDWHECLEVVAPHRRRWVIYTIGLAHKYLDLEIDDLPFESEAKKIPGWILRCVEKEWRQPDNFEGIINSSRNARHFLRQVSRRLPPNPLRATIEENGDLDSRMRWWYQIKVVAKHVGPFAKDVIVYTLNAVKGRPD
jgi:Uncharacterised nucleotidyltransferase